MPFRNPIVAGEELVIPAIRSDNYVESVDGWRISRDGNAEFANANITGSIGADSLYGSTVSVGQGGLILNDGSVVGDRFDALDAQTDTLNALNLLSRPLPGEIICGGYFNLNATDGIKSGSKTTTGEVGIASISTGLMRKGWYLVYADGLRFRTDTIDSNTALRVNVRRETRFDGTTPPWPSTSSPVWLGPYQVQPRAVNTDITVGPLFGIFRAGDNNDWFRLMYSYEIGNTAGAVGSVSLSSELTFIVTYLGNPWGDTVESGGIQGKGAIWAVGGETQNEPPPPPPPDTTPTKHTKTYYMDWHVSFQGDGDPMHDHPGVNPDRLYQGGAGLLSDGDTKSATGLSASDLTDLRNRLNGATNRVMRFSFTPAHTYYNNGTDFRIGTHTWTSKPSQWSSSKTNIQDYTKRAVTGTQATVDVSDKFIDRFLNDAAGFVFGPTDNSLRQYGYVYQDGTGQGPQLYISYYK